MKITSTYIAVLLLVSACDGSSGVDAGPGTDAGPSDAGRPPDRLSDGFRATLANPAPEELTQGEWDFFHNTWNAEVDGLPPPEFLVDLWQSDEASWGEQFSAYGWIIDPEDNLPIGLKRGFVDETRSSLTCAACHVSQLPDGRLWSGFPATHLRMNAWRLAVDDAWVAAGNPSQYSDTERAVLASLPQPGVDSVGPADSPYPSPVDFPFYMNFSHRSLFGTDGNAGDARSAILISMFSFRGADNPLPFPRDPISQPIVDFITALETPRPLSVDTAMVARGAEVFDEARCSACHHPDDQHTEQIIEWVDAGPELLPGDDPDHPHGTIATDGQRLLMTMFSGGVDTGREDFAIFIVRHGLRIGTSDGYIPRDIHAAFASAPYLHNGSVPTLEDLLLPADQRPTTFELDGVTVDTATSGMSNQGHEFGTTLSDPDKTALVAYLESL
ncbi:MAG: hypothetical protein AB7S26_33720 [Sandaracinaceae bacterium]